MVKPVSVQYRKCRQVVGAPDTIRTCDLCLRRATLYPAELRVRCGPLSRLAVRRHPGPVGRGARPEKQSSHVRIVSGAPGKACAERGLTGAGCFPRNWHVETDY